MRRLITLFALGIFLFGFLGCTQSGTSTTQPDSTTPSTPNPTNPTGAGGQTITIRIANFAFSPVQVTVKQGDTVIWVNDDSAPHQIKGSGFESSALSKGQSYEHRFTETPGDYAYICAIHTSMHGTVTVTTK